MLSENYETTERSWNKCSISRPEVNLLEYTLVLRLFSWRGGGLQRTLWSPRNEEIQVSFLRVFVWTVKRPLEINLVYHFHFLWYNGYLSLQQTQCADHIYYILAIFCNVRVRNHYWHSFTTRPLQLYLRFKGKGCYPSVYPHIHFRILFYMK